MLLAIGFGLGMRMFPVAPFLVRTSTADTPVSNCIIPKDAIIMMSIFNLHYVSNDRVVCPSQLSNTVQHFLVM